LLYEKYYDQKGRGAAPRPVKKYKKLQAFLTEEKKVVPALVRE